MKCITLLTIIGLLAVIFVENAQSETATEAGDIEEIPKPPSEDQKGPEDGDKKEDDKKSETSDKGGKDGSSSGDELVELLKKLLDDDKKGLSLDKLMDMLKELLGIGKSSNDALEDMAKKFLSGGGGDLEDLLKKLLGGGENKEESGGVELEDLLKKLLGGGGDDDEKKSLFDIFLSKA